ncbi:hypothetical protein [Cryptosporangium sp. NPDC048952]|uniref:hypothetical protein n=1 Tax=Cryptosporangium sp. NPDC048952 TaxID=3363961 RepID=UPI00370F7A1F
MASGRVAGLSGVARPLRGALVEVDRSGPLSKLIVFQYNPHQITRSVRARSVGEEDPEAAKADALRLTGPPIETLSMTVEVDAADQPDPVAGVHSQLAAVETLLYPPSEQVRANRSLSTSGSFEIVPALAPLALLVWGPRRVVPVRLSDVSITEEAFDAELNPVRAKLGLTLRVLTYLDLPADNPGAHVFFAHHVAKEKMAERAVVMTSAGTGSLTFSSFAATLRPGVR